MPRCYMVKKALCNKYMSTTRGFEPWGRNRNSPPLTNQQQPEIPAVSEQIKEKCVIVQNKNIPVSTETCRIESPLPLSPSLPPSPSPPPSPQQQESPDSPSSKEEFHKNQQQQQQQQLDHPLPSQEKCNIQQQQLDQQEQQLQQQEQQELQEIQEIQEIQELDNPQSSEETFYILETSPKDRSSSLSMCPPQTYEKNLTIEHLIPHNSVIQETPLFRDRSAAETEAAHDLLELSRSLPPLPHPSVAIGPQDVIETPVINENVQEISIYQPESSIYRVNTIDIGGNTATVYQQQPTGIIYEPSSTIVQQTSNGVFIPLSPVQEILFTYSSSNDIPSIITGATTTTQPALEAPPLTPPTSECSSDIENNNPNLQPKLQDKEVQTITEQTEIKAASYTYDTLIVADGRSKNKKTTVTPTITTTTSSSSSTSISTLATSKTNGQNNNETDDNTEAPETSKVGRYVCCECGKQYATSSNLSRHKQTHRSIDSQSAKKCIHCGKAYVSMPALAMHVLTHKLTHSCGVCGKMFSRPWLLQGHLRSHTGEKPYGCAHCGKAFADRSNLRAHMQTHSSDKNYECPKCRKSFALKSYLNKHLESACQLREPGDDSSSNDIDTPSPVHPTIHSTNITVN